ncbi:ATP-binding protein [Alteromonas sp. ASW11-36]|uniref:histidine kinase n=1 Tax=Alteromonas arenosi TaxID=3055817 RepID=A0ABT7T0Z4_9ALTE|nr:ATP-binding protein [Alteromonas sp. ASW11-36]MDM7862107.1 ATP-binding protein [Alteromonas sp. ASW11-36]
MQKPALPDNEVERLAALQSYNIMDSDADPVLDDLTDIIAELCNVPIALVSLVDDHRQWFKAACGLNAEQTDKDIAFCAHAIHGDDIFEVSNALDDPRFHDNPLVTGDPHIRFYAGMPLITEDNFALGTLCVIDTKPRILTDKQRQFLRSLAGEVVTRFELERKNRQLMQAQQLQRLISDTNQDYIFVKDEDFRIVFANKAFMTLYPENMQDKIIGYTTVEDYKPEEAEQFLADDRYAFANGRIERFETIVFPDGATRTLFTTKLRFKDTENANYILGVARDVTEREALIDSLKKSNADLDEFAYVASHDLRSPLTAIRRLIEWVKDDAVGKLDPESLRHIEMIETRADRMNRLLSDLLQYSQVGRQQHEAETLELESIVADCVQLIDVPAGFSVTAVNQALLLPKFPLELVLTNLISNAIKHHDKATGNIAVDCQELEASYAIQVSDDGPGIAPEHRQKVFEKFTRLQSEDQVVGSGLGLAMVVKMVEHYGGSIAIEDNAPRGCTFIIQWPKTHSVRDH